MPHPNRTQRRPSSPRPTGEKILNCYAITEGSNPDAKAFWTRIGRAFKNRDGSLTLRLNALPVDAKIIVRAEDPRPRQEAPSDGSDGEPVDSDGIPF